METAEQAESSAVLGFTTNRLSGAVDTSGLSSRSSSSSSPDQNMTAIDSCEPHSSSLDQPSRPQLGKTARDAIQNEKRKTVQSEAVAVAETPVRRKRQRRGVPRPTEAPVRRSQTTEPLAVDLKRINRQNIKWTDEEINQALLWIHQNRDQWYTSRVTTSKAIAAALGWKRKPSSILCKVSELWKRYHRCHFLVRHEADGKLIESVKVYKSRSAEFKYFKQCALAFGKPKPHNLLVYMDKSKPCVPSNCSESPLPGPEYSASSSRKAAPLTPIPGTSIHPMEHSMTDPHPYPHHHSSARDPSGEHHMGSASVERVNRRGSAHSIISETSTGVSQYAAMPSRNDQRPSAALATPAHGSQDASYSSSTMRTADRNRQTSPNNMASSRSSFFAHNEQDASFNSPSRPRNAHATSSVASPVSRIRSVDHATMPSTTAHEATATSNDKASSSLSSMHQDGPASSNPRRVRTSSTSVVPSAMPSEMDNSMAHFSTSIKKRSTDMHTLQKLSFDELEELLERIQLEKNIVRDLGVKLDIQRDEVMLAMWEKNRQQDAEEFQRYITEKRRRILEREQQLHI